MARHWFTPETPDVLGMLHRQVEVTVDGARGLAAWAAGDSESAGQVREAERRGEEAKRALVETLRDAFVTPVEPEDLFALSQAMNRALDHMKDLVNESEAMSTTPDEGLARMTDLLLEAWGRIDEAIGSLRRDGAEATAPADEALRAERRMDHAYLSGMAELLEIEDRNERIARRELYRACARIGESIVELAERIVYAVMKQS